MQYEVYTNWVPLCMTSYDAIYRMSFTKHITRACYVTYPIKQYLKIHYIYRAGYTTFLVALYEADI